MTTHTNKAIFNILKSAQNRLKHPRLKYLIEDFGQKKDKITFYIAGQASKHRGQIQMVGDGEYGVRPYYGRIEEKEDGVEIHWGMGDDSLAHIRRLVLAILDNPLEFAKLQGQRYSYCVFCGRELTEKNSLTVGYGPICAEKYGLPWEGAAEEAKRKEIEADL